MQSTRRPPKSSDYLFCVSAKYNTMDLYAGAPFQFQLGGGRGQLPQALNILANSENNKVE